MRTDTALVTTTVMRTDVIKTASLITALMIAVMVRTAVVITVVMRTESTNKGVINSTRVTSSKRVHLRMYLWYTHAR